MRTSSSANLCTCLRNKGEDSQWLFARQSSDENYVFNREVAGPRNVAGESPDPLTIYSLCAPVAQRIRALVFGTRGRGFESLPVYQTNGLYESTDFLFGK